MALFNYYSAENDINFIASEDAKLNEINTGGDKSITQRALLFAALAQGRSVIYNSSHSLDGLAAAAAIESLGVKIRRHAGCNYIEVSSGGIGNFIEPAGFIDCANSGTAARLMMGVLARASERTFFLSGDSSLLKRPMSRIARPLESMGAGVKLRSGGFLPAAVSGSKLRGIDYYNEFNSAQVKASLIFAAAGAKSKSVINEKFMTRNHSEIMAPCFGIEIKTALMKNSCYKVSLSGGQKFLPARLKIPNDPSTAAFYIALDALYQLVYSKPLNFKLKKVLINPARCGFYEKLFDCGFDVIYTGYDSREFVEPVADMQVHYGALAPLSSLYINSPAEVTAMIDEIPLMALVLSFAAGESVIEGLSELRVKECDRLAVLTAGLNKMGARLHIKDGALIIEGIKKLKGARLSSYNDHRMAMTFIVAGILSGGDFSVDNCECVAVSNPDFFDVLRGAGFKFHIT